MYVIFCVFFIDISATVLVAQNGNECGRYEITIPYSNFPWETTFLRCSWQYFSFRNKSLVLERRPFKQLQPRAPFGRMDLMTMIPQEAAAQRVEVAGEDLALLED